MTHHTALEGQQVCKEEENMHCSGAEWRSQTERGQMRQLQIFTSVAGRKTVEWAPSECSILPRGY